MVRQTEFGVCPSLTFFSLSFSVGYRPCSLPAVVQASDSLPDTVSCLFPEQAEAQLSAKTQGTPTVTASSLFTQHREMFDKDIFKHAGLLAGVHVWAFSLCSRAVCDSLLLFQGQFDRCYFKGIGF